MENNIDEMINILSDNTAITIAKVYSINKNYVETMYKLGKIVEFDKLNTDKKLEKRVKDLNKKVETNIDINTLKMALKFYKYVSAGMIKSYNIKWDKYLEYMELDNIEEINKIISNHNNLNHNLLYDSKI